MARPYLHCSAGGQICSARQALTYSPNSTGGLTHLPCLSMRQRVNPSRFTLRSFSSEAVIRYSLSATKATCLRFISVPPSNLPARTASE